MVVNRIWMYESVLFYLFLTLIVQSVVVGFVKSRANFPGLVRASETKSALVLTSWWK
jgi:hypothetical protein